MGRMVDAGSDDATLAALLRAVAHPGRLSALRQLRLPRLVSDIRLMRTGPDGTGPMTRQGAQRHLDVLVQTGLVRERAVKRAHRSLVEYEVNTTRLYRLAEEFRELAVREVVHGPPADLTHTFTTSSRSVVPEGPRLTVVHGTNEGRSYSLVTTDPARDSIVIGRRGADVSLDDDGHVSQRHAELRCGSKGRWAVEDLESKNGTRVNWMGCPPGQPCDLSSGDILAVGRSRFVFVAPPPSDVPGRRR